MRRIVKSSNITVGEKKEISEVNSFNKLDFDMEEHDKAKDPIERIKESEKLIKNKINEADNQAKMIISEAYEDAKLIYRNAKSEGYQIGFSEGYESGRTEAEAIIQEALSIKKQVQMSKEKMQKDLEKDIVQLVLSITEKILFTKLEESRSTILGLVKLGLEKCTYTDSLSIRVSPKDYEYVRSVKDKILCLAENIEDIIIKQDASLKEGSCILDTISGSIDSSIQTQMDQISSMLLELLESERTVE